MERQVTEPSGTSGTSREASDAAGRPWRNLGQALKRLRVERDIGQKAVVAALDGHYSDERYIRRIESGERRPSRAALVVWAVNALGITTGRTGVIPVVEEVTRSGRCLRAPIRVGDPWPARVVRTARNRLGWSHRHLARLRRLIRQGR
jgi:transcriptional regulator with XRE-family HTH domain